MKVPVPVSGVWLRTAGKDPKYPNMKKLEVLAEVNGTWRLLFAELVPDYEGEISHIQEGNGIILAPPDPLSIVMQSGVEARA